MTEYKVLQQEVQPRRVRRVANLNNHYLPTYLPSYLTGLIQVELLRFPSIS